MTIFQKIWKYGNEFIIDYVVAPFFMFFPKKDVIMFESVPNFSDSPKAVFDELIKRQYNKKYKIIWWLYDDNNTNVEIDNVFCIRDSDSRLIRKYYEYTAKCLISCNRFLNAHSKKQKSFYIIHGSPLKRVAGYYNLPKGINYYFCASDEFKKNLAVQFNTSEEKGIGLGLPRNDVMGEIPKPIRQYFKCNCKKIIVWYPTFRQHKSGMKTGSKHAFPILHDSETIREVNEYAREKNVLIVIKPHFAQDLRMFKAENLSNISFIDDSFFETDKFSSYQFVNSCDALITDYSSIYYDYLLCDKPIGLTWEDIEEYRTNPGFSVDIDFYCKGGEKIYTLSNLKNFIEEIATGVDLLKEERREINKLVNYSSDHMNTKRVTDKIIELGGL